MGNVIMSDKERKQSCVFNRIKNKEITKTLAASMLKMSTRWLRTKYGRYLRHGDAGITHKSRGKTSPRRWDKGERDFVTALFRGDFAGFEPTYGAEKLLELHNIKVSKETLRQALIEEGLWQAGKKRSVYRKKRERKPCFGIMVQFDGSPHNWFEERAPRCTLLVAIDDATSALVWLEFVPSESLESVMTATRHYLEKHGRPCSFYVDYGSVFSVNTNNPEREKITQFERACKELNIEVIHARSPQAKGRVERVNRTLQARLVKELRLAGISNMEEANAFVQNVYIEQHNKKFAQPAAQNGNAYRSLEGFDLNNVFCSKNVRVLQNDFTVTYKNHRLQLNKHQQAVLFPKNHIVVYEHLDGHLSLWVRNIKLEFTELEPRPVRIKNAVDYVNTHRNDNLPNINDKSISNLPVLRNLSPECCKEPCRSDLCVG